MKIVAKPIEVISWTDKRGDINPVRFRIESEDGELITMSIWKILDKKLEKLGGNKMIVFKCQSVINNEARFLELKYELDSCKWMLFKI